MENVRCLYLCSYCSCCSSGWCLLLLLSNCFSSNASSLSLFAVPFCCLAYPSLAPSTGVLVGALTGGMEVSPKSPVACTRGSDSSMILLEVDSPALLVSVRSFVSCTCCCTCCCACCCTCCCCTCCCCTCCCCTCCCCTCSWHSQKVPFLPSCRFNSNPIVSNRNGISIQFDSINNRCFPRHPNNSNSHHTTYPAKPSAKVGSSRNFERSYASRPSPVTNGEVHTS